MHASQITRKRASQEWMCITPSCSSTTGPTGPTGPAGSGGSGTLASVLELGATGDTNQFIELIGDASYMKISDSVSSNVQFPSTSSISFSDSGITSMMETVSNDTHSSVNLSYSQGTTHTMSITCSNDGNNIVLDGSRGNSGDVLTNMGKSVSWAPISASITLTDVLNSGPTGGTNQSIYLKGDTFDSTGARLNITGTRNTVDTMTTLSSTSLLISYSRSSSGGGIGGGGIGGVIGGIPEEAHTILFTNLSYGNQLLLDDDSGSNGYVLTSGGPTGGMTWGPPGGPLSSVLTAGPTADLNQSIYLTGNAIDSTGAVLSITGFVEAEDCTNIITSSSISIHDNSSIATRTATMDLSGISLSNVFDGNTHSLSLSVSEYGNQLLLNGYAGEPGQVMISGGTSGELSWIYGNIAAVLSAGPTADLNQSIYLTGNALESTGAMLSISGAYGQEICTNRITSISMNLSDSNTSEGTSWSSTFGSGIALSYTNGNTSSLNLTSASGHGNQLLLNGSPGLNGYVLTSGGSTGEMTWSPASTSSLSYGNVALVDYANGNDATASVGGLPFATLQAALNVVSTNQTIYLLPGIYTVSPFTLAGIRIQGINNSCVIQYTASSATTFITMGENSALENLTLNLVSTSHVQLTGILFEGTSTCTSHMTNVNVNVDNSSASSGGSSDVNGINCNGISSPLSSFSWNAIQGCNIQVQSNGGGKKRGILVSGSNTVTTRNTNVSVSRPSITSTGSYVGIETNDSVSQQGSIQLRSTTVGAAPPTVGYVYTASDILQTTPSTINSPSYLASPGIQVGPGTDLVSKNAGGLGFSTFCYPTILYYGLKNNVSSGTSGYLWPGTQVASAGAFPDSGTPPAYFRIQQPSILSGISCALTTGSGSLNGVTALIRYTPVGTTTVLDTAFTCTLVGSTTTFYKYDNSLALNAGDKIHVFMSYTGNNANTAHDLTIQLDIF